jgi:NitT/TauT family transport system substrate-binding protein
MTAPLTPIRFQLNTFLSGPQAWLLLAEARGHLAAAGAHIEWVPGDTAANVVPRMRADPSLAMGYGDLSALIAHQARQATPDGAAPMAVFNAYNTSPYTIAVPAESTRRTPQDLAGARILTHPNDAARLLFAEFCQSTGLDAASVTIVDDPAPHSELVPQLLAGRDARGDRFDALFGFVNTLAAASIDAGLSPDALRHLDYRTHVPDLYGMALMTQPAWAKANTDLLGRVVAALNQGFKDCVANPDAAIGALDAHIRATRPAAEHWTPRNREANTQRLRRTLGFEFAHPEGARLGIGDLDDERLARACALMARAQGLPRVPAPGELFTRRWLPPLKDRLHTLAG